MATNTEVGVKITVDGSQAQSSVGSIKKQLREATQDLIAMREKFGETSAEAVAAAKRVAGLKDEIGDAKALTEAFNPDAKFKAFGAALQGVAGGFAALQGAQALFGSESKELEKTLVKVQGALALSQGLNSILEAQDSFKNLKTVAVDAFKGIQKAIGSTGIGLLVVALGTIYAYWDDIKEAVNGVSEEQEKLNKRTKDNYETQKKKLDTIGAQDNILKLQGKSEKDILKIKLDQYDVTIKAAEATVASEEAIAKQRQEAAERNYNFTKQLARTGLEIAAVGLRVLAAPIDALIGAANKVSETLGFGKITTENINDQITKLNEAAAEGVAKFLFDPAETKAEGDKVVKEAKDTLLKLKNDKAGLVLQLKEIDKKEASDAAKIKEEKDKELEKQREEELKKQKEHAQKLAEQEKQSDEFRYRESLARAKSDFDRKLLEISYQNEKQTEEQLKLLEQGLISEQEFKNRKAIIDAEERVKTEALNKERADKETADAKAKQDKLTEDEKKAAEERKKIAEAEAKAKEEIQNAYFTTVAAGLGLVKTLFEKNKGVQKAVLIAENALTIAKIILDAQKQIAGAAASAALVPPLLPPGVPNPAWFAAKAFAAKQIAFAKINAGIGIATSIAATAKGLSQIGGGGSAGGGGSVGGGGQAVPDVTAPPLQPQAQSTLLNQSQVNQIGNAAARAYVVESDVSSGQERIQRLNRAARIG
jgi:chromosome segregation ATPase